MANLSAVSLARRARADANRDTPEARVQRVLERLSQVPRMPDVGQHRGWCELRGHTDCLAAEIERILTGGDQ